MGDWLSDVVNFRHAEQLRRVSRINVTTVGGRKWSESRDGNLAEPQGWCPGFVVDTRPDLEVASILPGLYLGSQDVAYEETILRDLGITHILNLVPDSPNLFENRIVYKNVPLLDDTSGKLRFYLGGCLDFIDSGRAVGAVLVHCNAGISRAPAVVIAYLMARTGVSLDNAIASVRSVRPVARPNPTFMEQLREYERELQHSPVQKQNGRAES